MGFFSAESKSTSTADSSRQTLQAGDNSSVILIRGGGKGSTTVMGDFFKITKGGSINLTQTVSDRGAGGESSFPDSIFGQGAGGGGSAGGPPPGFSVSPMTLGIIGAVLLGVFFLLKRK